MLSTIKEANNLINEKSPYLMQHAYNPVNWYPWCEEAFEKAQREDKPIFLSIGYSTCHWCHVMENESFEDMETAEILNENFISIKVDKEERPDIDNIYMDVCQILTGSGGWPLSIFLTPQQKPFHAGTYYPKKSKYGLLSFKELLSRIHVYWEEDREKILSSTKNIMNILTKERTPDFEVSEDIVNQTFEVIKDNFDSDYGGLKGAPKFPTPQNIYFLLRYHYIYKDRDSLAMAEKTLTCMYEGGIFDHVGFGFSRYSTDSIWLAPHFEKMLYDNALLMMAYGEAYQVTKNKLYKDVVGKIFTFIKREMTDEKGGFYTALDADSEGEEGKYYLWDKSEVIDTLGSEAGERLCKAYDITEAGNFESKNILNLINKNNKDLDESGSIEKLFECRNKRVRPSRDDKILTGQNGMLIAALSYCGRIFDNKEYIGCAERALNYIEENLIDKSGRLLAVGASEIKGYAEDYSYLIWGLLELYYATGEIKYLSLSKRLNDELVDLFWDNGSGSLYFTGCDAEKLLLRQKKFYDGAYPSANSVSAMNFIKLSRILNNKELEDKAKIICDNLGSDAHEISKIHLLSAYMFLNREYESISILGNIDDKLKQTINNYYLPFHVVKFDEENEKIGVSVCKGTSCLPITESCEQLVKILG